MDYAGEERKRQRQALAILLTGGGFQEEDAGRRGKSPPPVPEAAAPVSEGRGTESTLRPDSPSPETSKRRERADGDTAPVWRTGPFPDGEGGEWDRNAAGYSDWAETASSRQDGAGTAPAKPSGPEDHPLPEAGTWDTPSPERREASFPPDTAGTRRRAEAPPPGTEDRMEEGDRREMAPAAPAVRMFAKGRAEAGRRAQRPGGAEAAALPEAGLRMEAAPAPQWGGAAEAKALSLAFQRDARRYDGGFSIY